MKRPWLIHLLTVLLALFGAYVSYHLVLKHEVKTSGLAWFDSTCEADEEAESNRSCDEVLATRWGTFPPLPKDAPADAESKPADVFGLFQMRPRPVGLFGMMYFSALIAWYILVGRPSYRRRIWHLFILLVNFAGVAGAGFFTYLMFFAEIEAWCPWCMVTHVCNFLVLVGGIMLWPRKPKPLPAPVAEQTADGEPEPQPTPAPPPELDRIHPSGRLVFAVFGCVIALFVAQWYFYNYAYEYRGKRMISGQYKRLAAEMKKIQQHAETLYGMYMQNEKKDIPLRDDDPIINPGDNKLRAVVFSDFRCPHCARFAKYVSETLEPMFEGELKVVFKHYPAEKVCNQYLSKDLHPGACAASFAAEAARILGGNDAFWKAHDLMFESRGQLRKSDFYLKLADSLGLDRTQFLETMGAPEVTTRIKEDIDLAKKIGLRGTPSLYLAGRHVPSVARGQQVFWDEIKRRFDAIRQARLRQKAQQKQQQSNPSAKPRRPEPTEGPPAPPPGQ